MTIFRFSEGALYNFSFLKGCFVQFFFSGKVLCRIFLFWQGVLHDFLSDKFALYNFFSPVLQKKKKKKKKKME